MNDNQHRPRRTFMEILRSSDPETWTDEDLDYLEFIVKEKGELSNRAFKEFCGDVVAVGIRTICGLKSEGRSCLMSAEALHQTFDPRRLRYLYRYASGWSVLPRSEDTREIMIGGRGRQVRVIRRFTEIMSDRLARALAASVELE